MQKVLGIISKNQRIVQKLQNMKFLSKLIIYVLIFPFLGCSLLGIEENEEVAVETTPKANSGIQSEYSSCVGNCDTYWEIFDQTRNWPLEIETMNPSLSLRSDISYPDPTAYFDNNSSKFPGGPDYLISKWIHRKDLRICMMFDFNEIDNLTSTRIEELRLAIEDGFWLWQRGLVGYDNISKKRMEVKINKIVARNVNWVSQPLGVEINNNGMSNAPAGCGGISIPGTLNGATNATENDIDYKFSFHDNLTLIGAYGVAGWRENILSYPGDWDGDGVNEDWQGVRQHYGKTIEDLNKKSNFTLYHEIGHLTRLGDCVFSDIPSIMCSPKWPQHSEYTSNVEYKARPTPYDYAWLRKHYSLNF